MISFENDYSEGAHPAILESLVKTNFEQLPGYGRDKYCEAAKEKIREACKCNNADVFFMTGGTQTNQVMIDTLIGRHEGVIAAQTGHVSVHESGAIEITGHKVLELPQKEGKLSASKIREYINTFYADENLEFMVYPGMVYISHPTEYGTLYTKKELTDISAVCREFHIPLYIDGARLTYGLVSDTDVTLADIAELCDAFYIGGTKVGLLCGEAAVFTKNNMPKNFVSLVKQRGALLAKGRLLGVQFDRLFTDDLYLDIARNAIDTANEIRRILKKKGYDFYMENTTNQIFVILGNQKAEEIQKYIRLGFWETYDDNHLIMRFATSWATRMEDVRFLEEIL